jgi:HJR/Mrr/RecB family endonuclease
MLAAEWEDYVVEVLRTLGATVERSPRSLDEGVTLIAHFGSRRVAILPHGEGQVVDSTTVHRAVGQMKRHHCDSSAVILNRRFTGAAQDFASRNSCSLIGLEEFPDFVMGQRAV